MKMNNNDKATFADYRESADYIKARLGGRVPEFAMILGSGLGDFADNLSNPTVIPYEEIPHFPTSSAPGHAGMLVVGELEGKCVLVMKGRFHYYEGWEMWQTAYPIGVFSLLGIGKMIITNAAGGIGYNDGREMEPGNLVLVTDQIKLAPMSPLRGANIEEFGERFFDMQSVFDKDLRTLAHKVAERSGFELLEGVYAYMSGPQYETPAEIRALKILGANLVGMSTVAEVIFAAQLGIRVLCVSCVSNLAAGITGEAITEKEVLDITARNAEKLKALLSGVVAEG